MSDRNKGGEFATGNRASAGRPVGAKTLLKSCEKVALKTLEAAAESGDVEAARTILHFKQSRFSV